MAKPDSDGNIVCTGCERQLPGTVEYFHQHRDGFKPKCKECRGSTFGVKSPNKVFDAKDGHKFCSSCHKELPATDDYFFNGGKDSNGLTSQCKKCQSGSDYGTQRPNYQREDGLWKCVPCGVVYERTEENFYSRGDSLMVYCKDCHTQKCNQNRRELENAVENTLTQKEWGEIAKSWNGSCAYCSDKPDTLERDHVNALSSGGGTRKENIVPACPTCNRSKGNKDIDEWYTEQPFYDKQRHNRIIHVSYEQL